MNLVQCKVIVRVSNGSRARAAGATLRAKDWRPFTVSDIKKNRPDLRPAGRTMNSPGTAGLFWGRNAYGSVVAASATGFPE